MHHSYKLNNLIELPYKEIWDRGLIDAIDDNTCVMFDTGALSMLPRYFLNRICKASKNAKMVVIAMDSVHGASEHIRKAIPNLLASNGMQFYLMIKTIVRNTDFNFWDRVYIQSWTTSLPINKKVMSTMLEEIRPVEIKKFLACTKNLKKLM